MQFDITEILNSTTSEFYLIYSPKKKTTNNNVHYHKNKKNLNKQKRHKTCTTVHDEYKQILILVRI